MLSLALAFVPLIVFVGAALLGMGVRRRMKAYHKAPETTELLRVTTMMLVTFAALVLGLLITSAKQTYDSVDNAVHKYAAALIELDTALRAIGPRVEPARRDLIQYTAAMIASTWTTEKPPAGDYYPKGVSDAHDYIPMQNQQLGDILKTVGKAIFALPETTSTEVSLRQDAIRLMNNVWQSRWTLISTSDASFSLPFYIMLNFWLFIVFLSLGLTAPLNALSVLTVTLSSVALASALFVIVDLSTLYEGIFLISSKPMRGALEQMLH